MKKQYFYSILIAIVFLSPTISFGQIKATTQTNVTLSKPTALEPKAEPVKEESLATKKAYVDAQLKVLLGQLNSIFSRTQIAIDRLAEKDIDTKDAQIKLDISSEALIKARTDIEAFSAIRVTDEEDTEKTAALSVTLREAVKKAEDDLKIARESLIESLTSLKASVSLSIKAQ